jgi:DNA-binding response OmpR family regulator/tetratricopeptide (TPR) repeat protein
VSRLHLDALRIDLEAGTVEGGARLLTLSERERDLLRLLASADGGIVPRDTLGGPGGSRAADMAVSRLRKRLGSAGQRLVTVRGVGYRLAIDAPSEGLDLGWGRLELGRRRVQLRDRAVELTGQQALLLGLLAEAPGRPVRREELARGLWGQGADPARLDLALHRLRRRLEVDPERPRFLVTLRGGAVVLLDARPAGGARSDLPDPAPLLGRSDELARTLGLLQGAPRRALLHGPPGIGKSALATRTLVDWVRARPGRTHVAVDLHGVKSGGEAELRLASALGMESVARDDLVVRSLAGRGACLLVVDGGLPGALAERLAGWVDQVPRLRALVAARLAAVGWPVVELDGLEPEAARSLLERAAGRALGPGVDRIRTKLDGNPLALELVGTGLRHASVADLDRRLALPLTALRRAWRTCLEDLPDSERALALASSPFHRPFDVADVASVASIPEAEAATRVDGLLLRSVLQPAGGGRVALSHAARELLQGGVKGAERRSLVRAYRGRTRDVLRALVERLPRGGGACLDDLEQRWPDLERALDVGEVGPVGDPVVLARLARDASERAPAARREGWADDLLAAAGRDDLSGGDRALCLQAVHAILWSGQSRAEREQLLRTALALATDGGEPVVAAGVAAELASVVAFSFGIAEARQLLRAHPMPEHAPVIDRVRRLRHEGRLGVLAGRPKAGLNLLQDAVAEADAAGLPLLEAHCRMALGQALSAGTLGQEAEHHLRRAIALTQEHGLPEQHVRANLRLAQHLLRLGLRPEAGELLDRALSAAVRAGLTRLEEQCCTTLGYLMVGERRLEPALVHLDRAVQLSREHGGKRALYVALCNRGLALTLAGRPSEARVDLAAALEGAGGAAGWYGALGLAYQAVAELVDGAAGPCRASVTQAVALLVELDHPDAAPLREALEVAAGLAEGSREPAEIGAWVAAWSGGAEVEGVVDAVEQALPTCYRRKGSAV